MRTWNVCISFFHPCVTTNNSWEFILVTATRTGTELKVKYIIITANWGSRKGVLCLHFSPSSQCERLARACGEWRPTPGAGKTSTFLLEQGRLGFRLQRARSVGVTSSTRMSRVMLTGLPATGKGQEAWGSSVGVTSFSPGICTLSFRTQYYSDFFPKQTHQRTLWQPWAEPGRWVFLSRSYLVCPPDHQVREYSDPGDGAKERDGKKLSWRLKENQEEARASAPSMRWTWETQAKSTNAATPPHCLPSL